MKSRDFNIYTRPYLVVVSLFLITPLLAAPAAQGNKDDDEDVITVVITVKKNIKKLKRDLKRIKKENKAAAREISGPTVTFTQSAPRVAATVRQAKETEAMLEATIQKAETLIRRVERSPQDPQRNDWILEARHAIGTARMGRVALGTTSKSLQRLGRMAETSRRLPSVLTREEQQDLSIAAFGDEEGGGVFLNRTATMPFKRQEISKAEYNLNTKRFVLHRHGKKILLPVMDSNMVAAATKCLYYGGERDQVAVSMMIDPIDKKRMRASFPGHSRVLFGCKHLWNTELGRILIDADDILTMIWQGRNRRGENLTQKYRYTSLIQMTLDHPATIALINNQDFDDMETGIRIWIRPAQIEGQLSPQGAEVWFKDVSFEMLSETVRLSSPKFFTGSLIPNPGADAFVEYFNTEFHRFENIPSREKGDGTVIRPLQEIKAAAIVVGVLRWIKGMQGQQPIPMDIAWVADYRIATDRTRHSLPDIKLGDVEAEIIPPIVIFSEHGPSRMINADGKMSKVYYDARGEFLKVLPVKKTSDGKIIESNGYSILR